MAPTINELLACLIREVEWTGDIAVDTVTVLVSCGLESTAEHCQRVAAEAGRLAGLFGVLPECAQVAGWLHDVSAVYPVDQRARVASELGIEVLPEERLAPMLLHQKLSAALAKEVFQVTNPAVLSAIECHTTLKANASPLDKTVFVADKIAWDQPGDPPYLADLCRALECSLDDAALCYMDYLWQRRARLLAVHPWLVDAYEELSSRR